MSDAPEVRKLPTAAQRAWLKRGLDEPGGKLPLFDGDGRQVDPRTIRACIDQGWAEPWYHNPLKPDWLVCKLTERGRALAGRPKRSPPPPKRERQLPSNVTPIR
ncbi:MAG TPA: hypothetical protein VLV50_08255 [Stellaceae bacterium]|nr:hypothetical protein [Stellaceae bacterium]